MANSEEHPKLLRRFQRWWAEPQSSAVAVEAQHSDTARLEAIARGALVEVGREASRQLQLWIHEARLGTGARSSVMSLDEHTSEKAIAEDVRLDHFIKEELRKRFGAEALAYSEESPAPSAYELVPKQW